MTSIADGAVNIQTTSESNLATPGWFGEVVVISRYLRKNGVLGKINKQMRFARKRFGRYDVIDLSFGALRLCHQRGTHPGGVLPASPAVCRPIYGLV